MSRYCFLPSSSLRLNFCMNITYVSIRSFALQVATNPSFSVYTNTRTHSRIVNSPVTYVYKFQWMAQSAVITYFTCRTWIWWLEINLIRYSTVFFAFFFRFPKNLLWKEFFLKMRRISRIKLYDSEIRSKEIMLSYFFFIIKKFA